MRALASTTSLPPPASTVMAVLILAGCVVAVPLIVMTPPALASVIASDWSSLVMCSPAPSTVEVTAASAAVGSADAQPSRATAAPSAARARKGDMGRVPPGGRGPAGVARPVSPEMTRADGVDSARRLSSGASPPKLSSPGAAAAKFSDGDRLPGPVPEPRHVGDHTRLTRSESPTNDIATALGDVDVRCGPQIPAHLPSVPGEAADRAHRGPESERAAMRTARDGARGARTRLRSRGCG